MTLLRTVAITLGCVMALACGGPKLPPGLTPQQQDSIKAARLVEQVGATVEGAGYLITAMSNTLAVLGTAGTIEPSKEIELQTALSAIVRNMRRRVDELSASIKAGERPSVRRVASELRSDVDDLLSRVVLIPDVASRAELRSIALALRLTLITLDISGQVL